MAQRVLCPAGFAQSGNISAYENPCTIYLTKDVCTSLISWSSSGTSYVEVWVTPVGQSETLFASSGTGNHSQNAGWIGDVDQVGGYYFRLYDYTGGSRGALLDWVIVEGERVLMCDPDDFPY